MSNEGNNGPSPHDPGLGISEPLPPGVPRVDHFERVVCVRCERKTLHAVRGPIRCCKECELQSDTRVSFPERVARMAESGATGQAQSKGGTGAAEPKPGGSDVVEMLGRAKVNQMNPRDRVMIARMELLQMGLEGLAKMSAALIQLGGGQMDCERLVSAADSLLYLAFGIDVGSETK